MRFAENEAVTPNPNWPKFKMGETIGIGGDIENIPEGFELRKGIKNLDGPFPSANIPEEVLGVQPGSSVHVIGRSPGKYIVTSHDARNPVVLLDKEVVEQYGFEPDKFNWEPLDDEE